MKKIYIYTLSTLLLWGAASCKKPNDFGDTNFNPSAPVNPVVSALLANVMQANTVSGFATSGLASFASVGTEAESGAQYAQYFSETQYPGTSLYILPQNDFVGRYNGSLYDLQTVINVNESKNSVAVAKILQSYIYWVITDSWGDVPYSQALQGLKNIKPAYDKQEDIYKGILSTLASAVSSMDGGAVPGDLIYGGNAESWKKAANSLRMLVAIQLSRKVSGASDYAATAFKAAEAAGYITDNSQNFAITYPGGVFIDPYYTLYDGRTDFAESKTVTDLTTSLNDGRTVPYGGAFNDPDQTNGGTVTSSVGVPPGLDRTGVTAFTDAHHDYAMVLRADQRTKTGTVVLISAAEVALSIAEAANIGWTSDNIVASYKNGVNLSFAQYGLPAPAAGYFTNAQTIISPTPQGPITDAIAKQKTGNFKNIAIQQWLTAYPDGHMGWNIWRKTSWPELTPAPGLQNTSKQIVRRFIYALTEQQTNPESVKAAIAREVGPDAGTDSQDNTVFWDPGLIKPAQHQ